jgi:hypothetical protein
MASNSEHAIGCFFGESTMAAGAWQVRVESGISAIFDDIQGTTRPGTTWAVSLTQGSRTCRTFVKALFADDANAATRENRDYQAQIVVRYLHDQLRGGWQPLRTLEHTIYVHNPPLPLIARTAAHGAAKKFG